MPDRKSERRSAVKPAPVKQISLFMCNSCYFNVNDCVEYYSCSNCDLKYCRKCYKRYNECGHCNKIVTTNSSISGESSSNFDDFVVVKHKSYFFCCF